MVATVQILENNTVSQTTTDKTAGTVRFKTADNATVDGLSPVVVPASTPNYSFEKWLSLNVTVAPVTNITNLRIYSDGASGFGTGVALFCKAVSAFTTPALGSTLSGFADFFSYTSGASLTTAATSGTTFTGTGQKGYFAVFVLQVSSTATQGALTAETFTWSYDET